MPRPEQMAVSCSITLSVPVTQNTEQSGVGQGLPPTEWAGKLSAGCSGHSLETPCANIRLPDVWGAGEAWRSGRNGAAGGMWGGGVRTRQP